MGNFWHPVLRFMAGLLGKFVSTPKASLDPQSAQGMRDAVSTLSDEMPPDLTGSEKFKQGGADLLGSEKFKRASQDQPPIPCTQNCRCMLTMGLNQIEHVKKA